MTKMCIGRHIPGGIWGFVGSSFATAAAGSMGSSPIIIHIESAAGIKEGGRTGLVGVIVGGLFAVSTFFAPLYPSFSPTYFSVDRSTASLHIGPRRPRVFKKRFGKIPPCATAPVLILVGTMMMSEATNIDWREFDQAP